MAKKNKSGRALTGIRQLVKQVPTCAAYWQVVEGEPGSWKADASGGFPDSPSMGWHNIAHPTNCGVYHESYLDLSGYELDDLTTVLRNVRIQDPGVYTFSGQDKVYAIYDMITSERLTDAELVLMLDNHTPTLQSGPGFALGPLDRDQIHFGLYRMFGHNSTNVGLPELMMNLRTSRFGSGEPTAVQKLWVYRVMIMIGQPAGPQTIALPATSFVVNAEIIKESEMPYMMRLKRSYELAQI